MDMSPEMAALYNRAMETNEAIVTALNSLNSVPTTVALPSAKAQEALRKAGDGVDGGQDQIDSVIQRRIVTAEKMDEIKSSLKGKSIRELNILFAKQASRRDTGIPLYDWLGAGGAPVAARWDGIHEKVEPGVAKAIDTNGVSALIRQDLEPIIYELFVRKFPLFDLLQREPANGLVHAFNQMLSYGSANWIGELDTVVDDKGEYHRSFTNVGILATRRGVSLKSQFAVLAGGAGFNPERLELTAGLRAMAATYQATILHGNWTDNSGTIDNELGPYDEDSFDGWRKLFNTANAVNVDPATNPDTTGSLRRAFDAAILPIADAGDADNLVLWGSPQEQATFDEQQDEKLRILQSAQAQDTTVGVRATKVQTVLGPMPFYGVRGGFNSAYDYAGATSGGVTAGDDVRDVFAVDLDSMSIPYLGSESPTVLEIPIGVTGQLTHLFIIFFMGGLAVKAPPFSNKVRV